MGNIFDYPVIEDMPLSKVKEELSRMQMIDEPWFNKALQEAVKFIDQREKQEEFFKWLINYIFEGNIYCDGDQYEAFCKLCCEKLAKLGYLESVDGAYQRKEADE